MLMAGPRSPLLGPNMGGTASANSRGRLHRARSLGHRSGPDFSTGPLEARMGIELDSREVSWGPLRPARAPRPAGVPLAEVRSAESAFARSVRRTLLAARRRMSVTSETRNLRA